MYLYIFHLDIYLASKLKNTHIKKERQDQSMIGSVRNSPLCSPRNTSLNLRSGLPKSPAADMLPVPLGLLWVLMCCYNFQIALNKKIKRLFGSVWDSQPPIQAPFCAATYHDTHRDVIDSWAQPIELERIQ